METEKGEKIKLKSGEVGVIFATGLTEDRHQPASSGTSDNEKWEETFIPGGFLRLISHLLMGHYIT